MRKLSPALHVFLAVCSAVSFSQPTSASPWPRFRGPNGTGVSTDKNVPVEWSDDQGVLWKKPIPGLGNSSPVVWGNRVFLQSATEDGKERLLLCLNVADGEVVWSQSVPGSKPLQKHGRNTLASSSPASDGERVYALFWDGRRLLLSAYDFQGNQLWKDDLGVFNTIFDKINRHGAGASPIVYGDKVFVANDQTGASELLAVHAKTGKVAWTAPRKAFRACYSAPFVLEESGNGAELIVASTGGVTSYNPQTGHENWNYTWDFSGFRMPLRTVASPLYSAGLIFANSGDGSGDRLSIAIRAGGKGEIGKDSLVWEKKGRGGLPYVPTMLVSGEYLYYIHDITGVASCCVAKTGENVWSERLGGGFTASPIVIDGKIYAINEEGTVYVFAAASSFKLLAKNSMGEPVMATPAVADNRLFIRGKTHLFCIGKRPDKGAPRDK